MQKITLILTFSFSFLTLYSQKYQDEIANSILKGNEQYAIFEEEHDKEMTKIVTGKGANEERMHYATLMTFYFYGKAIELSQNSNIQINDSTVASKLMDIRPRLVDAGIYYNDKQKYLNAMHAFLSHWNYERLQPFLEQHDIRIEQDSTNAVIKYYAVICSVEIGYVSKSIQLLNRLISEPYVENSSYKESDLYELLSMQYEAKGDNKLYMESLKIGAEKFPTNPYFPSELVNLYFKEEDYKAAISLVEKMIEDKLGDYDTHITTIANIYLQQKDYKSAEKIFKAMQKKDKNNIKALEGFGRMYELMAQDKKYERLMATSRKQMDKLGKEAVKQYKKALPYLEKQYELLSNEEEKDRRAIRSNLLLLTDIYYNLTLYDTKYEDALRKVEELLDEYPH